GDWSSDVCSSDVNSSARWLGAHLSLDPRSNGQRENAATRFIEPVENIPGKAFPVSNLDQCCAGDQNNGHNIQSDSDLGNSSARRAPFYQTRSRPVAERGQIKFRSCDLLPNSKHVPKADVIHDEEKRVMKINGLQLLEQFAFEDAVFRSIHEQQFRFLNQAAVQIEHRCVEQITNLL